MRFFLVGLICLWTAAKPLAATPKTETVKPGGPAKSADEMDPVERDYLKLLAEDDAAQKEADKWITDNEKFAEAGAGLSQPALRAKLEKRFERVEKAYEDFFARNPKHVRARLAYGSFLNDIGKEFEASEAWEKARELDPANPASWNNLANYYGHRGPVKKSFEYYAKAIELNSKEPIYYHNFATTVFLFRKDAQEFYKIDEQKVFDRALELYAQAQKLAPKDFQLATDIAQTYYGIRPPRVKESLAAWDYALGVASDPAEREGVYLHMARVKISAGDFEGARAHLAAVSNESLAALKTRLVKSLADHEAKAKTAAAPTPEEKK